MAALIPLTSEQIEWLKKSFRQVDAHRVAATFYINLFNEFPELKSMFTHDMHDQVTKLVSVFELVVFSFKEKKNNQFVIQEEVMRPLQELGRLHTKKGVENFHYPIVNNLLIAALRSEAGSAFTLNIEV